MHGNFSDAKTLTFEDEAVFKTFCPEGAILELRVLGAKGKLPLFGQDYINGTLSGYFDNQGDFWRYAKAIDEKLPNKGIYFTIQKIDQRLHARAYNRLKPTDSATKDSDVITYARLPIDIDPERPAGISSSDLEVQAAIDLSEQITAYVLSDFKLPPPVKAMSGNGVHLLFPLPDLPATKENVEFVHNTLKHLSERFRNKQAKIDETVYNPARIMRVYGTVTRKGDDLPSVHGREARPHRRSFIWDLGDGRGK